MPARTSASLESPASLGTPPTSARWAGLALVVGVLLYIFPTALHGNPPIEDAEATLEYVADRPLWTIAHLVNIGAVLLWVAAVALLRRSGHLSRDAGVVAGAFWSVAGGAFAVYFGIHAIGLWSASEQYADSHIDSAAVIERTESMLLVLGSAAFVAQALIGVSLAVLAFALRTPTPFLRVIRWAGVAIGLGWMLGAVLLNFAIIVPCTVLAWVWCVVLGARLLRR